MSTSSECFERRIEPRAQICAAGDAPQLDDLGLYRQCRVHLSALQGLCFVW
jgi:hypothetical protein